MEHREEVGRELGRIMKKVGNICEPRDVDGWRELAAEYDKELEKVEVQRDELIATLKEVLAVGASLRGRSAGYLTPVGLAALYREWETAYRKASSVIARAERGEAKP